MGVIKNLMFDLINENQDFYNFKYPSNWGFYQSKGLTLKNPSIEFTNDNKLKIDLPYLDLNKLSSYIENGYLIIKYNNPDDCRRKTYEHTIYVGDSDIKIKYENGFLIIEKEKKEPERKYVNISSK